MHSSQETLYDIAIIGGGIAGAGIARDAALRGAKVVLFEKNTFGSGTSSKSSKLIHGGLRYLETAWKELLAAHFSGFWKNLKFVFLALRETHRLHVLAPELIHPLPLIVPIYKNSNRSRWAVYFGTFVYGMLAKINGNPHFSKILNSKEKVLKLIPDLNPEGLLGGVIVWDHSTDDYSLVQATMESAKKLGAVLFERARVENYRKNSGGIFEVNINRNGKTEIHKARKLINASGPWVDQVRGLSGAKNEAMVSPVAGAHIELKKFFPYSVILEAGDGRLFFMINRKDRARVGTTERVCENPDQVEATPEEINYLLSAVNKFFPGHHFQSSHILCSDAGIRPLAKPQRAVSANQISREHQFVEDESGVVHVLGVKLTDHRRAAEELMDKLAPELARMNPAVQLHSRTREIKLTAV